MALAPCHPWNRCVCWLPACGIEAFACCARAGPDAGGRELAHARSKRRIGVPLFQRHGPRITVSDQGVVLAEDVDAALALMQSAVNRSQSAQRAIRVTCAPTFASRWLVPRSRSITRWRARSPLRLMRHATFGPAQFDVAIRSGAGRWRGFSAVKLLPELGTPMLSRSLLRKKERVSIRRLLELPLIPDGRWGEWFTARGAAGCEAFLRCDSLPHLRA